MASGSVDSSKSPTRPPKPKKVRKRITQLPILDDDKIYKEVLEGHFNDSFPETKSRKRRRSKSSSQRKWWWPKSPIPTNTEREKLINEIEAIYKANDYLRPLGSMPHEFHETEWILKHLERLKSGLIPDITKKGITHVETQDGD